MDDDSHTLQRLKLRDQVGRHHHHHYYYHHYHHHYHHCNIIIAIFIINNTDIINNPVIIIIIIINNSVIIIIINIIITIIIIINMIILPFPYGTAVSHSLDRTYSTHLTTYTSMQYYMHSLEHRTIHIYSHMTQS